LQRSKAIFDWVFGLMVRSLAKSVLPRFELELALATVIEPSRELV
jgi:hypothetical protein